MSEMVELQGAFYILASSSLADVASRVLKHGDTFAIFDRTVTFGRSDLRRRACFTKGRALSPG
jgi:hypothetical protein